MITRNDEATYQDALGHFPLVRQVAETIANCEPPYVVGICGPWGAGKTSFIRKLEVALGGDPEEASDQTSTGSNNPQRTQPVPTLTIRKMIQSEQSARIEKRKESQEQLKSWVLEQFGEGFEPPNRTKEIDGNDGDWHLVRFNPWHHQFEDTPVVALLQEIRRNLSFKYKAWSEAGKIIDVSVHAGLSLIGDVIKAAAVVTNPANLASPGDYSAPNFNTKAILERGIAYEDEHYMSLLSSQRFRNAFEVAISLVVGDQGRLVIFIDDLDRCEGDIAFKLLESLKLHLNARNCIYVLGIDQGHLVETVARSLRGDKTDEETAHWHARNYLDKLFQTIFLLPIPHNAREFIRSVLCPRENGSNEAATLDEEFNSLLCKRFSWNSGKDLDELVEILDRNLPHNPRKIKAFIASWKLNLRQLNAQLDIQESRGQQQEPLYWKTSLVLNYLAFFEEPIFRRIEREPHFYFLGLQAFCTQEGTLTPWQRELDRLHLTEQAFEDLTTVDSVKRELRKEEEGKKSRPLYVAPLIIALAKTKAMSGLSTSERAIRRHLLATGGMWLDEKPDETPTESNKASAE